MLRRTFGFLLSAAIFHSPALASDYSNLCRSADGVYQMDDGSLSRVSDDGSPGPEIAYKMLREIELSHENGYCLTRSGKRYDHQVKSYTQRVSFADDGRAMEIDMVCELIADGMPANETCDRDVITSSTRTGGTPPAPEPFPVASSNIWSHNGSVMRLIAQGERRTFVYETPRAGMRAAGAKRGDAVFEGTRVGSTYSGTAYIFKKGCDPQGYSVTGDVSSSERRVTLYGQKPKIAANCRIERYLDDTLVFDLEGE